MISQRWNWKVVKEIKTPAKKILTKKEVLLKEDKVTKNEKPLVLTEAQETTKTSLAPVINFASPSAKKIATESKIDLTKIKGSGKNGIILSDNVEPNPLPNINSSTITFEATSQIRNLIYKRS